MSDQPDTEATILPADPHSHTMIAARLFDTPLLIHERKLQQILHVLGPRLEIDLAAPPPEQRYRSIESARAALEQAAMQAGARAVWNPEGRYYNVGFAAVIPVIGSLVQRSSWLGSLSGLVSYAQIEQSFSHALADQSVEEIVFEMDTPGGEVAGAFDLAERIYSARDEKPTTAIASEFAASAGYLLASAAGTVVLPATGSVGSIGVVAAHVDRSREMEKRGIAVTFVYAGDKKIDGNPYQKLSDRAKAEWQDDIDEIYGMFVAAVARHRGMSESAVRATQAGMFMGRKAVDAKLADRINTFGNEVNNLSLRRGGANRLTATKEDKSMSDKEKSEQAKAVADARAEGVAEGRKAAEAEAEKVKADAVKAAVTAERARVKAIVTDEAAKGREEFASHLAFETEMATDQALAMLSKAPVGASKGQLAKVMEQIAGPGISSTDGGDAPAKTVGIDTAAIYAEQNKPYNKALSR